MTKQIKKILIANRGEIACRIIKTARKMGIATVAVYSDADRKALHVRSADESVHIGPSPAVESYLVIDKIINAAKQTGADAIHPGYGFLSENPNFVRACHAAGLTFIGPSAEAMEAMGLKDAAKKLMEKSGVPVTPGYHGKDQSPKLLKAKAGMIGYPVLIKAVAGGGGKGMRKVETDSDFDAALASCMRETKSSFGNDAVLIEKYIQSPRHIEVQVFGDSHGNIVHMFERDCSLQRRHQKVIEEAPAPGMTDAVRRAMTDAAIAAAKAVDYTGAGTVEFIVDGSGKLRTDGFWFMEMNTRLQVEHPVTEMITGLDLVELQIRVAQGEALPAQDAIKMEGHAIEARLYAEDPVRDFLPTPGQIAYLDDDDFGNKTEGCRIDTGYEGGAGIPVHYDPMICKIIGYGEDREDATEQTLRGIRQIEVYPAITNNTFLINCLTSKRFISEKLSTHFINDNIETLIPFDLRSRPEIFGLAAIRLLADLEDDEGPFGGATGWRLNTSENRVFTFKGENGPVDVRVERQTEQYVDIQIGNDPIRTFSLYPDLSIWKIEDGLLSYDDWRSRVKPGYISLYGFDQFAQVYFYDFAETSTVSIGDSLIAPMPGKIIAVNAKPGDSVKAGEPLIVMEAMKMEMSLDAPRAGVVARVEVQVGALVAGGDLLLELEAGECTGN